MGQNPIKNIYDKLTMFDRKILTRIIKQIEKEDANTKAYTIRLIDFELDLLNPSDITQRLKRLTQVTTQIEIDGNDAAVPLLTHILYEDHRKTVTLTFNSILKPFYLELKKELHKINRL